MAVYVEPGVAAAVIRDRGGIDLEDLTNGSDDARHMKIRGSSEQELLLGARQGRR